MIYRGYPITITPDGERFCVRYRSRLHRTWAHVGTYHSAHHGEHCAKAAIDAEIQRLERQQGDGAA